MAVPSNNAAYLVNTTGGTYIDQTQGGTLLGNTFTNTDQITKALALKDNATEFKDGTKPKVLDNGLSANQKALTAGTFAYEEEGKYVIARSSSTLSGVSKTQLLTMGRGDNRKSIATFQGDYGAKLLTGWRQNQFSWTGTLDSGATITNMRINWLSSAGTAAASPAALTGTAMAGATSGSDVQGTADNAGNPTRAIPGELVMKVDFVTLSVSSGGDFFDYKPITGM